MNCELLDALEATFLSAKLLFKARPVAPQVSAYKESWYTAMRSILELSTGLLNLCSMEEGDALFHDFGEEPQTVEDAFRLLPQFLNRCLELLAQKRASPDFACPFPSIEVRATTFFCLLCEAVETSANDGTA